jgi:hypothetical protein
MNDNTWRGFLRVLDTTETGAEVTSNRLRDLLAAADIPEKSRGGLFAQAVEHGYLRRAGYVQSTGDTANRSPIRKYRRTRTPINAGGGDYQGLPTTPVRYRSRSKASSIDWDQITEQYVAAGGQVDASVWPNHGKVVVIGGTANSSKANIHTFTEAGEYDEPAGAPSTRQKRKRTTTATSSTRRVIKVPAEKRPEIARRYHEGESVPVLAKAYDVSEGSIRYAIQKAGGQIRSKREASALYFGSAS